MNGARDVIEQIWYRARINAFAHKEAMLEYSGKETQFFRNTILTSLGSILSIIVVYIISTSKGDSIDLYFFCIANSSLIVLFTFISIILTVWSLYLGIMSNHNRFGIRAEEHKYLLNSYQHIAQRAREIKWPDKPDDEIVELLKDLERDFALLKARGSEPLDSHYDLAHNVFRKVRDDKDTSIAQSFEVDKNNQ